MKKVLKNSGTKAITQPWTHQTCNLKYMSQCNFFFQTTTNLGDWIPTKVISACLHAYLSMNKLLMIPSYRYRKFFMRFFCFFCCINQKPSMIVLSSVIYILSRRVARQRASVWLRILRNLAKFQLIQTTFSHYFFYGE